MIRIPFGEYLPDQAPFLREGLSVADGCVPIANGYAPVGQLAPLVGGALSDAPTGAAAYTVSGSSYIFGATRNGIYRYLASGFTPLRTDLLDSESTRFLAYGRFMLAANGANKIQRFDANSPSTMADLSANAPTARYLATSRGIVIAGYADGNSLRVRWSDSADIGNWTGGGASLAGTFDMASGGDITGVVGGEYALVFQEQRVLRMTFTGDNSIWQFDEISTNVGCIAAGSIATWGKLTFFLSSQGFMVCDGSSVTPIGQQKVDRTFAIAAQPDLYMRMSAAIDPINSAYVVTLPNTYPSSKAFVFNWVLNRWSTFSQQMQQVFQSYAQSTSLEDLNALYASLDAMTITLDSASFKGGSPLIMAFTASNMLGTFSGAPQQAMFSDSNREFVSGRRARLRAVRPITDAPLVTVQISGKNALSAVGDVALIANRQTNGIFRDRSTYDFMQLTLTIPAGQQWSFAQGLDVDVIAGGRA